MRGSWCGRRRDVGEGGSSGCAGMGVEGARSGRMRGEWGVSRRREGREL